MKIYTPQTSETNHFLWNDDFSSLYKIYVGLEKDRNGQIAHLEIIDGYLKENERLFLKTHSIIENGISLFELEIIPHVKMNTYLKVAVELPVVNSVLVKAYKQGTLLGYQWIDLAGNILSVPEKRISKPESHEFSI